MATFSSDNKTINVAFQLVSKLVQITNPVIFLQIGNSGSWVPLKLKSMGHLWNSWVPYRNVLFSE